METKTEYSFEMIEAMSKDLAAEREKVRVLREALVESNHMLRHHVEDWDETDHTYEDIDAALEQTAQALAEAVGPTLYQ